MSGTETPQDVFALYKQNVDEFFAGIEKFLPNYHQSITGLQEQWLQTCGNTLKSVLSIQQELVNKAGINTTVPEAVLQAIRNTNAEILNAYSVQTHAALTAIDVTRQNLKAFNDGAGFFADMNKNVAYWMSMFTPTKN